MLDRVSISTSGYYRLGLQFWDVMWVEVSPSLPFDPEYYCPLIAGINGDRRRQFVATPIENYWFIRDKIAAISEGERTLVYRDFDGEEMHTDHFRVLVLRFDVESYPKARRDKAKTYGESQGPFIGPERNLLGDHTKETLSRYRQFMLIRNAIDLLRRSEPLSHCHIENYV